VECCSCDTKLALHRAVEVGGRGGVDSVWRQGRRARVSQRDESKSVENGDDRGNRKAR
jgi:hypothetical protein